MKKPSDKTSPEKENKKVHANKNSEDYKVREEENNSINEETVLFAIGKTTAAEIKKYSVNRVVVSDETEKKFLIGKAIKFFDKNQN